MNILMEYTVGRELLLLQIVYFFIKIFTEYTYKLTSWNLKYNPYITNKTLIPPKMPSTDTNQKGIPKHGSVPYNLNYIAPAQDWPQNNQIIN